MKYFLLVIGMLMPLFTYALEVPASLQSKMQVLCEEWNGKSDIDYPNTYHQNVLEKYPKEVLTDIYASLSQGYGKCQSFDFKEVIQKDDKLIGKIHLHTDKNLIVKWTIGIDGDGLIVTFFQEGILEKIKVEVKEEMVEMRDGTKLYTRIYRPENDTQKRPVVLTRTPYLDVIHWDGNAQYLVEQGYIFVVQSIRGRDRSEGTYKLFNRLEASDGYDAIQWIASQDFSNNKVAISGTSYDGFTALAAGVYNPPALKAIFSGGAPSEVRYNALTHNSSFLASVLDYLRYNTSLGESVFTSDFNQQVQNRISRTDALEDYDQLLIGRDIEEWNLMVEANQDPEAHSQYFFERSVYDLISDIKIPTYHIAGLRGDGDLIDTIRNFQKVDQGINRQFHHLILGFWNHGNSTPYGYVGAADYINQRYLPLLAYYLEGVDTPYAREPRVAMENNSGKFITGDRYPLSQKKQTLFFTDEALSAEYDSSDASTSLEFSPFNESALYYFDATLQASKDIQLFGTPKVDLYLQSALKSFDLQLVLYRTDADGKVQALSNCLSMHRVNNPSPGTPFKYTTDFCPVLGQVKAGESLHVVITTSRFPNVFANPNGPQGYEDGVVEILNSKQYPSSIELIVE